MARVLERLFDFRGGYAIHVRVWCQATDFRNLTEHESQRSQVKLVLDNIMGADPAEVAEDISKLPFVNAVEVRTPTEVFLIYPEWP